MYYGFPTPAAKHKANDMGEISLGGQATDVEGRDQLIPVRDRPVPSSRLKDLRTGKARLLINVYTARRANRDNLISCDVFEDDVEVAERATIQINCDLIRP